MKYGFIKVPWFSGKWYGLYMEEKVNLYKNIKYTYYLFLILLAINTKTTAARIAVSPSPPMEEVRLVKLFATDLGNDPAPPPKRRKATKPAIAIANANSVIFHMNLLICLMHSVRSLSLLSI